MAGRVVSRSRREARKAHFGAASDERRVRMAAPLSKSLKAEHGVRSIPVVKGDTVKVLRGTYAGREGVIASSYRRKWVITIEGVHRDKASGATVPIGVDASKCEVIGLKLNKDRKLILQRKSNKKSVEKSEDAEMKAVSSQLSEIERKK
ncbi:hypothetical protein JCM5353_008247 [Sporobolomyces roseus]